MSKPLISYRDGAICVSVWLSTKPMNGRLVNFHKVKIEKNYNKNGEWKQTQSFLIEDLLKISSLTQKIYWDLRLNKTQLKKSDPCNP